MGTYVAGPKGGIVSFVRDGVIERDVMLPVGVYPTAMIEKLREPGQVVMYDHAPVRKVGNALTCKPQGQFESAANPHFRMTAAARQARDLRAMMARAAAMEAGARKALSAMGRAKRAVPQIEDKTEVVADAPEVSAS